MRAPDFVAGGVVLIATGATLAPIRSHNLVKALANGQSVVRLGHKQLPISPDTVMLLIFGTGVPFYASMSRT